MKLVRFYASTISENTVEIQIFREDDVGNVYMKVIECDYADMKAEIDSMQGDWVMISGK